MLDTTDFRRPGLPIRIRSGAMGFFAKIERPALALLDPGGERRRGVSTDLWFSPAGAIGNLLQGSEVQDRNLSFEPPPFAPPPDAFGIVWPGISSACASSSGRLR